MAKPRAQLLDFGGSGRWQVVAKPWRSDPVNVTVFRDAPTEVSGISTTDPFGPAAATLRFPAVTLLESLGSGDLEWLAPETDVDIAWVSGDQALWTWEGYFSSYDYDQDGLSVSCSGAMRQLDNYQAKPEYLFQPLPYEEAIRRAFMNKPDLRMAAPTVAGMFPDWWQLVFSPDAYPADRPWLMPSEVRAGQLWSGMLTRETGHWEPMLTSYVQGLLSSMHTD